MKYRVNIDLANSTKAGLADLIDNRDNRVLNRVGAFSSLFHLDLKGYSDPVLVLKTEEPGSKQVLAFKHDRIESVCHDMINHLINDYVVMGAEPLAVQDLIVCGRLEKSIVTRIVSAAADACQAQGCALTGGETTEQPDIIPEGTYILGSSIAGMVEKSKIIDGSKIKPGDVVIAIQSSGPHTNGFTLIRDLLAKNPSLAEKRVGPARFIDAVLEPHKCYYQSIKGLFDKHLTGMAHITGGLFLIYLGIRTLLSKPAEDSESAKAVSHAGSYIETFFLTLTNPMTIIYFTAIFAGLNLAGSERNYTSAGVLVLGVFSGSALWWLILSSGTSIFSNRFNPKGTAMKWINLISGFVITGFGVSALISLI
jgi:phosphoribosylformylglycinamidine cyclo-ligase